MNGLRCIFCVELACVRFLARQVNRLPRLSHQFISIESRRPLMKVNLGAGFGLPCHLRVCSASDQRGASRLTRSMRRRVAAAASF